MPRIPIMDIARFGIVSDEPDHKQSPEAWTNARNVRFIDSKAERFLGDAEVMEPPSIDPAHLLNIQTGGGSYWLQAEANGAGSSVYVYNSGSHTDITNGAGYTVDAPEDWNSAILQGIPLLNYGDGVPQYWASIDVGTDLADLPAWPTDLTAKVISVYRNYAVALNTSHPTDNRPHRVLVSDSAEPGTLPTSWDHDDPAVDALEFDLSDVNSGEILWGAPLRDVFAIYKAEATWIMRHIGGQLIMGFDTILQTSGILAPRCATPITLPIQKVQVHFVHTGQDLGVFNGQDFESVVDRKVRKYLNANVDPQTFNTAFTVDNPAQDEAWFCYPENGMDAPNMALVWNYRRNTITFREFRGVHAASGVVETANTTTYDGLDDSVTYDNIGPIAYQDNARRKLIIADQAETHLLQADLGSDFNGTAFTSFVERTALAVIGQDREGNPICDYQQRRLVKRLWPKVRGGSAQIYFGGSQQIGEAVTYLSPVTYTPGQEFNFIDPPGDGVLNVRLPALKIILEEGASIEGYDIEIEPLGDN